MPHVVAIALGSNVGDREAHMRHAADQIRTLPGTEVIAMSPLYQTAAVGLPGQDAGGEYLNACMLIRTELPPRELLERLHGIERERGRDRGRETRWGPRTLDLDVLIYGDLTMNDPGLTIPHPRMQERVFVLEPLAAIAPDLQVPGLGRVTELLARLKAVSPP